MGVAVAAVVGLAPFGCGSPLPPFVQSVSERPLDQRSQTTVTTVEVCYNRATTTPEALRALAQEVCVKEGRQAVFVEHGFMQCPLMQPSNAYFDCRAERRDQPSDDRPFSR
jgi:hypothetical protein